MKNLYSILLVILLCLSSCTKEITVDITHEPKTIIYGTISQETETVTVQVHQSVPLNAQATSAPVNNATIFLYTRNASGNSSLVTSNFNVNQGLYSSSQPITAITGNTYWIEVVLNNGTTFKSAEELLKPVVPIMEVEISTDDYVTIYFSDPVEDTNFYKFETLLYNNGTLVSRNKSESNDVVFNGRNDAYVEMDLYNFQQEDEEDDSEDIIYDAVEIRFYNINFSSYQFYLNQSLQQEANDSEESGDPSQLFATPPVNLLGNIVNKSTNEVILGNFTVSTKSVEIQSIIN